jgi:hypothetical protein
LGKSPETTLSKQKTIRKEGVMANITEYDIQIKFTESGAEKTAKDIDKVKSSTDKLKSTIKGIGIAAILKKSTDAIGGFINKTSDYIETVNLFRASMGSAADKAQEFIDKAEQMLGLDPKSMMDSISSFQNLSESLGISSDRAYLMSQNLTQLAGDLSSFANISFEQAQKKLLSGFSGQVKPLREYGIALDQASLQETAYSLGLDQKVKNMTQAQKAELRYYQIMTSTQKVQGDLGRSLLSPANALRVMKTEFQRLARAIGSIFIPIMMKIIPVVRAVTQLLTEAAQAIAKFFGFEMGNFEADLSSVGNMLKGVSDGIEDIGDEADSTAGKLNKMLMPFDELNNITSNTGTGSAGGIGGIGGGGDLGLNLPEYNMFDSITGGMSEKVEKIKEIIKSILPILETIGAVLGTWKISNKVINTLDKIFQFSDGTKSSALKIALGLTLLISGIKLVWGSVEKMLNGDLSVQNLLLGLFGAGAAGLGAGMIASGLGLAAAGPIGWAVAIALAITVLATWIYKKDEELYTKIAAAQGLEYKDMSFWDKQKLHIDTTLEVVGLKSADNDTAWGRAVNEFHEGIKEKFGRAWEGITKFVTEKIPQETKVQANVLGTALGNLVRGIGEFIKSIPERLQSYWNTLWTFVKELPSKFWHWFTVDLPEYQKKMKELAGNVIKGFWEGLENMNEWLHEKISGWIDDFVGGFKNGLGIHSPSTVFSEIGENLIKGLTGGIDNLWGTLTSKFDDIKNLTNFEWKLPNLKTPHFSWSSQPASGYMATLLSKLNLPTSLPKLNISWYAQGGFPEAGQLFVANEAGPELIGNIGNRTAVANKDQITTAIANATYQAMTRALAENNQNDGQPIIVNVGNEQLYKGMTNYRNQQSNMYGINI